MRDQILAGINAAISDGTHTMLSTLGDTEIEVLADSILAALSETPEGTPEPRMETVPESTPILVLSPASVVAMVARGATDHMPADIEVLVEEVDEIDEVWAAGEDYREYREFLFRVQRMFGVRMRSSRLTVDGEDDTPMFRVAGFRPMVRAFQQVTQTIHSLAESVVADLSATEKRQFWATLGDLVIDTDEARDLVTRNRDLYRMATGYLIDVYGPARTLRRAMPATDGTAVYEQASALAQTTTQAATETAAGATV